MKILIVAFYYPPEDSWAKVASLRPYSWQKYWSKLGHQVYVVTDFKDHSEQSDPYIFPVDYWPSRPQWKNSKSSGNQAKSLNPISQKLNFYNKLRMLFRSVRSFVGIGSLIQISNFWIYPALRKILLLADEVDFDLIVSTYGPPANHIISSLAKRKKQCFWVADYRDLWYGNDFVLSSGIFAALEKKIESSCVSQANLISTVSQGLTKELKDRFQSAVITIENGFDPDDLEETQIRSWSDNKVRLMYAGQIYAGKRDPMPLFKSLVLLKNRYHDLSHKIEILFYGWNLDALNHLVDAMDLHDVVSVNTAKPRREILGLQQSVDALIFLDWNDTSVKGILTGKLFEYFFSGKPIIGIGSTPDSAAGALMKELGVGYPLGSSAKKIADFIERMLNGQSIGYSPQHEKIQHYTREHLANKMLDAIIGQIKEQECSGK